MDDMDAHPTSPARPRDALARWTHLRRLLLVAAALLVVAGPALAGTATSASADSTTPTVVVSGYDGTRVTDSWGLFSSCLATTNGYVTDAANFGPTGTVHVNLNLSGGGMPTATPAALAGVGIFFTGYVTTGSYTTDEKAALLNYVKAGGALIGTTDGTGYDMSDIFGMTLADGPGTTTGTITDPTSPLADGPFGTVTTFSQYATVGHYSNIGPGQTVGTNPDGPAIVVIPPGALGTGSGPVVMVSDVDVFSDCGNPEAEGSVTNEVLIKNIFAYLASFEASLPAPTTTTTAAPTTTSTAAPVTTAAPAAAVNTSPAFTG
jgi:hypothetical protein